MNGMSANSDGSSASSNAKPVGIPGIIAPPVVPSLRPADKAPTATNSDSAKTTANVASTADVRVSANEAVEPQKWARDSRLVSSLVSTILHTIALLLLALLTYTVSVQRPMISLEARQGEPTASVTLEILPNEDARFNHESSLAEKPTQINIVGIESSSPISSPVESQTPAVTLDPSEIGMLAHGSVTAKSTSRMRRLSGGGLAGRTPQGRKEFGQRYGATAESEAAVDMALEWLAAHQRPNGSWSFNLSLDPCNGRCRHGKANDEDTPTPTTGATGLALLAFLGAGHTHRQGPYKDEIRRGLYYLREAGAQTQHGLDWQHGSMYGHGIALMAVAEAVTMTRTEDRYDTDFLELAKQATQFTVIAQHDNGSWGYVPGSPGDLTISGWQVMSLMAARRNGIPLRSYTLPRAKSFVMSVREEDEWSFGYKTRHGEPTMDAIAMTLLLYLGQRLEYTPFLRGLDRIAERGPTLTNVYHDYYATLALHHARHRDWDQWNERLRNHLVSTQATRGHERGSWHFKDKWGDVGGRLYTTAMSAMILEVYYRYLPLYEEIKDFPL